jgi:preprotein translocase subunit SecD
MRKCFTSLAAGAIALAVLVPASSAGATPPHVVIVEKPVGKVSGPILREAVTIIAQRLNGIGVRGSAVYVQGNDIIIELPKADNDVRVGDVLAHGSVIKTAAAHLNSQTDQWEVGITFTGKGSTLFNKYAAAHYQCYEEDEGNPPYCALQAIDLDATVESGPAIEAASFNGRATINGSTSKPFTAQQASDLALVLSFGPDSR